jgi:hypothetical protein
MTKEKLSILALAQRQAHGVGLSNYADLLARYSDLYGEPLLGRTRAVFDRGDGFVIKVPLDDEGLLDNWSESRHDDEGLPLAKCTLEADGDCRILVMERVRMPTAEEARALPDWTDWIDCRQVGWTADGRLVAFDL